MAVTEQIVDAPPERVWHVLADGWSYSDWVVGTAHIRDVDPGWPTTGSRIHHKVGPWPLSIRDHTVVLEHDNGRRLLMRARFWPLGEAVIHISLAAFDGGRTRVTMSEEFAAGPLQWLRTKINDLVLHGRNRESLRRLADFAVHRGPKPS
ncbi:SRPBCC family protein [Rhizomonospora bruguierae]|uniref:SRPBCC family protein n=1 Tax=Rhizomonospora bruguierae TaxID=1581705 RepID=UPI001BCA7139|nr:SRPBCC family protein [Micromonospora sp. NBRC 107566]